jgi:hypothetical protein
MFRPLVLCLLAVVTAGCVTKRDASYAPGGTKTIVPPGIELWQAPVLLTNHLFHDRHTGVIFDIHITSIDGREYADDGRRTKYFYHVTPGPHVVGVSCMMSKIKWVADFDFILDPGDTAEITGELTSDGLMLWFADVNTGKPVSEKVKAIDERKRRG